jgi:glucose/mannose-6-phosphate isomerase
MNAMMEHILGLADQLRWGIDVDAPRVSPGRPVVVLGMGGSAMAATVGSLATTSGSPVEVHRSYGLPGWAEQSGAAVIAVSYSGNTEEVLSGVDEALSSELEVATIASGGKLLEVAAEGDLPHLRVPSGLQPRAAVGYQTAAVVRVLGASGLINNAKSQLGEAADVLDDLLAGGEGPAAEQGAAIAANLAGKTAVIYGGFGVGATAAYRWKTQLNENAKVPAYSGEVPEMNHNEIEGWHADSDEDFAIVYLRDAGDHPRIARRLDFAAEVIGDSVSSAGSVVSSGDGPVARFFSLAVVGDIASVAVAEQAGTDPGPVDTIERFKKLLVGGAE